MNIALFCDIFTPQVNGVVTATVAMAKGLADGGHKVHIIAPRFKSNFKELKHKNIIVHRIFSVPALFYEEFRFALISTRSLIKLIKKFNIQVIHYNGTQFLARQAIKVGKKQNIPVVGTFHTFFADPEYLKQIKLDFKFMEKATWKFLNSFFNNTDFVTSPAPSTRDAMLKMGCKTPIKVISNGIDINFFKKKAKPKSKSNSKPKGKTLLFIGRVAYEKSVDVLIESFKLVVQKAPDTKLLIVGSGPQFDLIKKQIIDLKLEKSVNLVGRIPYDKLVNSGMINDADIFVTASKTENQPLTILESQACGLPCVGVNKRGVPDLIINGENGFIVKADSPKLFADAILKLVQDGVVFNKMKKGTNKLVKQHDLKNVIPVWEKTLNDLIKNSKK